MNLMLPLSVFSKLQMYMTLLWIMFLSGCQNTEEKEIVIISTNDIHGRIEQFSKLATFVKRIKEEHPNVILVDAGDRFTGNPYVDHAKEKGFPIISLMNDLGYEVGTLGNHEFDFGQKNSSGQNKRRNLPDYLRQYQFLPGRTGQYSSLSYNREGRYQAGFH